MYTQDLLDIILLDIPKPPPRKETFLDITQQSARETIISRLYAYFLRHSDSRVRSLFYDTLCALITEKKSYTNVAAEDWWVDTEQPTSEGGFLDILIASGEHPDRMDSVILIENKIFHKLDNNLEDYWNSFPCTTDKKVGIVLSLKPIQTGSPHFHNILHRDWIARIKQAGFPLLSSRQYVYLTDFIQNMDNLIQDQHIDDLTRFYFSHTEKVNKAEEAKKTAHRYIYKQIEIAVAPLGFHISKYGYAYCEIWDGKSDAYYVVNYEEMFKIPHRFCVVVQCYRSALEKKAELQNLAEIYDSAKKIKLELNEHKGYYDLCHKWYAPKQHDLENLAAFIQKSIEVDFEPLLTKINNELHPA